MNLAKVGDVVIYTGIVKSIIYGDTKDLLDEFFEPGRRYLVEEVGIADNGVHFYKFKNFANPYPCESFVKEGKESLSFIYGLR